MGLFFVFKHKGENTRLLSSQDLKIVFVVFSSKLFTSIMRYVAAALLAGLGGKEVNASNIKSILGSVGIEAEKEKIDLVCKELAGKDIEELIAEGQTKLASMPAGGGGAAAPAAGGAAAPAAEAKKEEKKEEPEEESDDDMGFGLFD